MAMHAGDASTQVVLNGRFVSESCISVNNRGFMYGDGLFETIRVYKATLPLLEKHLERLEKGARYLGVPYDSSAIENAIKKISVAWQVSVNASGILKIILVRGETDRASYPAKNAGVDILCTYHSAEISGWLQNSVKLRMAAGQLTARSNQAAVKLLSRIDYIHAIRNDEVAPGEELLLCDNHAHVIDTPHHNIFWRKQGQLFTPSVVSSGVAGVMRQYLMEQSTSLPVTAVNIAQYSVATLEKADEVFLTNAVRGVVPVVAFHGRQLSDFSTANAIAELLSQNFEPPAIPVTH